MNGAEAMAEPPSPRTPHPVQTGGVHVTGKPYFGSQLMMAPDPSLTVVLATLNEVSNLPVVIDSVLQLHIPAVEIVVVDDGSTDGTRDYLLRTAERDPRVVPILNSQRQTLTPAQCQGITRATGDFVVVMDSDLQHPPRAVKDIYVELVRGADLVIGSRYLPAAGTGERSPYRGMLSRGAELIARSLLRNARGVSDPLSGFFGFRRTAFGVQTANARGNKLLLTLLATAHDCSIVEIPYQFENRRYGTSKITGEFEFVHLFLRETVRAKKLEMHRVRQLPTKKTGGSEEMSNPATSSREHGDLSVHPDTNESPARGR